VIGRSALALMSALGRRAPMVLVIGLVLGLALPRLGAVLRPALPALVVLLFGFALVRIDWSAVFAAFRRPWWIGGIVAVLMVAVPVGVYGVAAFLRLPADLTASLVLMACAPPIGSAPNLAFILGLDATVALNVVVVGTLLMPLIAPPMVFAILGLDLDVAPEIVALRLVATIAIALLLAAGFRRLLGRDRIHRHGSVLDGGTAVVMVLFVIAVMEGVQARLTKEPETVLAFLAAACVANFGLQALVAAFAPLARGPSAGPLRRQVLAVALMAGNRNIALFLAALPEHSVGFLTLFVAVYQIPMYVTPMFAGRLYRRLIGRDDTGP
jgi:BASS family bile acid:Na+ symporter